MIGLEGREEDLKGHGKDPADNRKNGWKCEKYLTFVDRVEGNGAEKPVWREVAREFLSGYLAAEAALSLIYDVVPLLQRDVDSYE